MYFYLVFHLNVSWASWKKEMIALWILLFCSLSWEDFSVGIIALCFQCFSLYLETWILDSAPLASALREGWQWHSWRWTSTRSPTTSLCRWEDEHGLYLSLFPSSPLLVLCFIQTIKWVRCSLAVTCSLGHVDLRGFVAKSVGIFPLENNKAQHVTSFYKLFEKMIQGDGLFPKALLNVIGFIILK